jgi:hypothetical protein
LTSEDKKIKKIYLAERDNLLKEFQAGKMTEEDYEDQKNLIDEKIDALGKKRVASKVLDNVLKWIQLKSMGWNVPGAISNISFGFVSNWIEAAGEEVYTRANLANAYKLVSRSVLKNASFDKYDNPIANKIRALMDSQDLMQDSSQELYASDFQSKSRFKFLFPYNLQKRSEYVNQAPLMVAMMMSKKVQTDKGEVSLWEAYDDNGKWNTAEYGAEPREVIDEHTISIIGMIQKNHGNYDKVSVLKGKETILGRMLFQFRTWLPEAIANRFEYARHDTSLNITTKGRYISLAHVIKDANRNNYLGALALETVKGTLNQLGFGFYKGDAGKFLNIKDKAGKNIENVDIANMRKVCTELAFITTMNLLALLFKGMKDDEDEEDKFALNFLINQNTRLRTDLLLYVNPTEWKNFSKDIIPAMSVIKSAYKTGEATSLFLQGEDTIERGINAGRSRLGIQLLKEMPIGNNAWSLYNFMQQEFKPKNN